MPAPVPCAAILLSLGAALAAVDTAPAPAPAPAPAAPAPAPEERPGAPVLQPAAAPAAAPAGPIFSLAQALADAHQLNDTTEIANARLAAARAAHQQAVALLLPTLTAGGQIGDYSISHPPFGQPNTRFASAAVNANVTLFNAAAWPGLKAANDLVKAQDLASEDLRRQLAYQVVVGYLGVISAEQNRDAAEQTLAVTQESLRVSQARAKVGLNSQNDATRAELDVANSQLALTNAGQAVTAARLSLGDLVGHAVEQRVADPGPAILPPGGVPGLEALALRTRPDLVSNLLVTREDEELERADKNLYYPTIGVFGTYENEGYRPNRPPGAQVPYWAVGLSGAWTIYDGGSRAGQVAQADATRRQAAAAEHQARQDLHRDLAIAVSNLATQQAAVDQSQVSLHVAEINDQETRTRYSQGLATQLDVSDANSALFSAKVALIAAQVTYANARYTLRQLVGWWPLQAADPHPSDEAEARRRQAAEPQP